MSSFFEDESGLLWIASGLARNGIALYDPNTSNFTVIKHDPLKPNSLSGVNIISIAQINPQ
jgi:hypothetical protein